jgi:hypothetical protein
MESEYKSFLEQLGGEVPDLAKQIRWAGAGQELVARSEGGGGGPACGPRPSPVQQAAGLPRRLLLLLLLRLLLLLLLLHWVCQFGPSARAWPCTQLTPTPTPPPSPWACRDTAPTDLDPCNLYVGSVSHDVSARDLEELFASCGQVLDARLIMDRWGGWHAGEGSRP